MCQEYEAEHRFMVRREQWMENDKLRDRIAALENESHERQVLLREVETRQVELEREVAKLRQANANNLEGWTQNVAGLNRKIARLERQLAAAEKVVELARSVLITQGAEEDSWLQPEHPLAELRAALAAYDRLRRGEETPDSPLDPSELRQWDPTKCPRCGGPTTHDRELPPNPYVCDECDPPKHREETL